jgi:hypothetical protein
MRIWTQYPPLVSPKDVSCGLKTYDAMRNSILDTYCHWHWHWHWTASQMKATYHTSRRLAVGLNFVFLQDSARSVYFRDSGNIETAVQGTGFSCRVSWDGNHFDRLILTDVSKETFATSFRVSVQIILNMEETAWSHMSVNTNPHSLVSITNLMHNSFILYIYIYILHYNPRHVSSNNMLILRRSNRIVTAPGIVTLKISEWSYITKMWSAVLLKTMR